MNTDLEDFDPDFDPDLDELERLSNSVVDHVQAGNLDAAEHACRELERRFPTQLDWIERRAMLHSARGEVERAVEYYRRAIEFVDLHPDGFDPEMKDDYAHHIRMLTSRTTRSPRA